MDDFDKKFNIVFNLALVVIILSILTGLGVLAGIGYVVYLLLSHASLI